jgi:hypothetical protein
MYPHRIRLRGPWECEPLSRDTQGPPVRVTMPCRWGEVGLACLGGRVRCRRRFGFPGRIDPHERVWLTTAGVSDRAEVALNGTLLGRVEGAAPAEFDVTDLLHSRNELIAEVEGPAEGGGLWGEVALEVRCTAFLRDVRAWISKEELHVTGTVVGSADGPLDLYVILGRRPLVEGRVTAEPAGGPFHLEARVPETGGQEGQPAAVQVDLVNGATVWYTIVQELTNDTAPSPPTPLPRFGGEG